jgi:hypothetical protein
MTFLLFSQVMRIFEQQVTEQRLNRNIDIYLDRTAPSPGEGRALTPTLSRRERGAKSLIPVSIKNRS